MQACSKEAHFPFSTREISEAAVDDETWHSFVRRREAEFIFSRFGERKFRSALELGAGDGGQSVTIAQYCAALVCTEIDQARFRPRNLPNVEYRIRDAEDLSCFPDDSFDLVFSSNMMEHLSDPERCLAESKRVLTPGGVIVVVVPNRTWKLFNTFLAPWLAKLPHVHGSSCNHVTEFIHFGRAYWERLFARSGLSIQETLALPFYVGYGPRFLPLLKLGNLSRLSASTAFVLSAS